MCGIVGYIGNRQASSILLDGLRRLEYRGYDSAGVATIENDGLTLMQREELLDWYIGPTLRTVPGVVEVNSFGGEDKQYQVVIDPKRLQAAGLSIIEVARALIDRLGKHEEMIDERTVDVWIGRLRREELQQPVEEAPVLKVARSLMKPLTEVPVRGMHEPHAPGL